MDQNKIIAIVLLVAGAVALFFGINAANAPMEEMAEAFTGKYSDGTMAYLIGGAAALIAGFVMLRKK